VEFRTHRCGGKTIREARRLVVHAHQLHPGFFDLSTRLAGEVLQKFTNYQVQLAIVGDFSVYPIRESNRGTQVVFVARPEEALQRLSRD
jgi:hypothetical protein